MKARTNKSKGKKKKGNLTIDHNDISMEADAQEGGSMEFISTHNQPNLGN